jgi:hypothetical protein
MLERRSSAAGTRLTAPPNSPSSRFGPKQPFHSLCGVDVLPRWTGLTRLWRCSARRFAAGALRLQTRDTVELTRASQR